MFLNLKIKKDNQLSFSKKQSGISMAFLLFVIIIVSLLAAALMRLNSESSISNAHQVISARAFFAAESGAQIQALTNFPVLGGVVACPAPYTLNFNTPGLTGCTAQITCNEIPITTGTPPTTTNYFQVISQGQCNAGQVMQATRTIEVRLKSL